MSCGAMEISFTSVTRRGWTYLQGRRRRTCSKVFVLAIDDVDCIDPHCRSCVRQQFSASPKIVARARNQAPCAHGLMDLGIEHIFRETMLSSLTMSKQVLTMAWDFDEGEVERISAKFRAARYAVTQGATCNSSFGGKDDSVMRKIRRPSSSRIVARRHQTLTVIRPSSSSSQFAQFTLVHLPPLLHRS